MPDKQQKPKSTGEVAEATWENVTRSAQAEGQLAKALLAKGFPKSNLDLELEDTRANSTMVTGVFTRYNTNPDWLFIWLDTGYLVRVRIKALQPIVDELVSKEVLNRLKGKEEE